MRVPDILLAIRDQRGWTQGQLARTAGISRGNVSDYESGRTSPTVATLNRILASVGLQIRAELEPLLAELDARVATVAREVGPLGDEVVVALGRAARALEGEHPYVVDRGPGNDPERGQGELRWGYDGETALRLQGLGFAVEAVQVAVHWDAVARTYFFRQRVLGTGGAPVSWFEATTEQAQQQLGDLAFGPFGMVRVRLLDEVPERVRLEVAPGLVLPVLTVDAVERSRPDLAEVLGRLRGRTREEDARVGGRSLGA
jgi:transcriptional regulator with XRE-family HTH domain